VGRQARQPGGGAGGHLLDAGDSAPLKGIHRRLQEVRRLRAGRRGPFAGALGENGRGLCESAGVLDDCHFIVGTFPRRWARIGGYCVSDDPDFDILRVTVRSYMFTASLPPRSWPRSASAARREGAA